MRVKEESKKAGLKLNVKNPKSIMVSVPITSWQREGAEKQKQKPYFHYLQNHCGCDCSHEVKRRLVFGKKTHDKPRQCIKQKRHHLPTKVCLFKVVFPVVMYGCASWIIKKTQCQSIHTFELWFWRRFLRVPWNTRRSNQWILKESTLNTHWKD